MRAGNGGKPEHRLRGTAGRFALTALLFFGCSSESSTTDGLPDLPSSSLEEFAPEVQEQIQTAYEEARENPDDAATVGRVGQLLHAYGQYNSAQPFYGRAQSLEPDDLAWPYFLGMCRRESADSEGARIALAQAVELDPFNAPSRFALAETLQALDRLEESSLHYRRTLDLNPKLSLVHYGLGQVRTRLGKKKEALESYLRASEISPDFGAAHYALALSYRDSRQSDQFAQQMALFERHKDKRPAIPDPLLEGLHNLKIGAVAHFERGFSYDQAEQYEQATEEYRKALSTKPDYPQAQVNLMSLLIKMGRLEEAEAQYRSCLEVNSEIPDIHFHYGRLLDLQGKTSEAIGSLQKALEMNPSYAGAHNELATLLSRSGNTEEAIAHYREALSIDASYRSARYNLARVLFFQKGKPDETIELLQSVVEPEDEHSAAIFDLLANGYAVTGKPQEAVRYGQRALGSAQRYGQPEMAFNARYNLARILLLQGQYQKTIELLDELTRREDEKTPAILYLLANAHNSAGQSEEAARLGRQALELARKMGQHALASNIEQSLGLSPQKPQ